MLAAGQLWGFLTAGTTSTATGSSTDIADSASMQRGNHDHPSPMGSKNPTIRLATRSQRNQIWLFSGTRFLSGYSTAYACHSLDTTSRQGFILGRYNSGITD